MASLSKDRGITEKGARAIFVASFLTRRRRLVYPKFVEVHDSHVESDFARAIGTVPQLEEVIDDVNAPPISDFRDYSWDWTNRLYKSKIAIQRDLFEFDQVKQTETLLASMAARLANLPDLIFATRLRNDSFYSGEALDSGTKIKLFASNHRPPIGSTTDQSNIITGTTTSAFCATAAVQTVAQQLLADFRAAQARMRGFLDDHGQPWHDDDIPADDFVILCSPLLAAPMRQAFFSNTINASDNVMRGMVREVVTMNYLPGASTHADAADWYLLNVGTLKRPFVYSRFRKIKDEELEDKYDKFVSGTESSGQSVSMDDIRELSSTMLEHNLNKQGANADADVINNERFLVAARWRGEMFGGEWRNALRIENAAS